VWAALAAILSPSDAEGYQASYHRTHAHTDDEQGRGEKII